MSISYTVREYSKDGLYNGFSDKLYLEQHFTELTDAIAFVTDNYKNATVVNGGSVGHQYISITENVGGRYVQAIRYYTLNSPSQC